MIDPSEIKIQSFCNRLDAQHDSERVKWNWRDVLESTRLVLTVAQVDTRPVCDRCKQHQDNIVIGFDGEYCADCYLAIYERWARHHDAAENPAQYDNIVEGEIIEPRPWRFGWLWRLTEIVGVALGLLPDTQYQEWIEANYYGSWSDPGPIKYVDDGRDYDAMAASPCSAGRNDVTGYANGDSVSRNC